MPKEKLAIDMLEQFVSFFKPMPWQEREDVIERLRIYLESHPEIIYAYVFGSFLSGMPFQDIDVALYVNKQKASAQNPEEEYAESFSETFKEIFDVVIINHAPSSLICSIFREGRLLFCKDDLLLSRCIESFSLYMLANEAVSKEFFFLMIE